MYVNPNMVAIPCVTIAERNNVVVMGKGIGFDSTEINVKPVSWMVKQFVMIVLNEKKMINIL